MPSYIVECLFNGSEWGNIRAIQAMEADHQPWREEECCCRTEVDLQQKSQWMVAWSVPNYTDHSEVTMSHDVVVWSIFRCFPALRVLCLSCPCLCRPGVVNLTFQPLFCGSLPRPALFNSGSPSHSLPVRHCILNHIPPPVLFFLKRPVKSILEFWF